MNIRVRFFGASTELTGTAEIKLQSNSTEECMQELLGRYPLLRNQTYALALNTRLIKENHLLQEGDVLALLPPFSGG